MREGQRRQEAARVRSGRAAVCAAHRGVGRRQRRLALPRQAARQVEPARPRPLDVVVDRDAQHHRARELVVGLARLAGLDLNHVDRVPVASVEPLDLRLHVCGRACTPNDIATSARGRTRVGERPSGGDGEGAGEREGEGPRAFLEEDARCEGIVVQIPKVDGDRSSLVVHFSVAIEDVVGHHLHAPQLRGRQHAILERRVVLVCPRRPGKSKGRAAWGWAG